MSKFSVVIFDCDGVMFDTRQANRNFYNKILSHFNRPPLDEEQFIRVHMYTVDEALAYLFGEGKLLEEAREYKDSLDYRIFIPAMIPEPDLVEVIRELRPGIRTAVATNRTDTIDGLLESFNLKDSFDIVVSASDVKRPKPFPDMLFKVLSGLGVKSEDAFYIGDSSVDQEAAEAAGISFGAYRNKSLTADYHINRLKELLPIVRNV